MHIRVYEFSDVKAQDVPQVRHVLDSGRDRGPRMIESGEEDAEVVDAVGAGDRTHGTHGTDVTNGDRRLAVRSGGGGTRGGHGVGEKTEDRRQKKEAERADARDNPRPVTVNVMNVVGNGGGGETRNAERGTRNPGDGDTRAEAQRRREHGKTLAAIRKKTDLIPGLVEKVDATPGRTAALVTGSGRRKLGVSGTVVEEDFTASAHFTNIRWRGEEYVIRRAAAVIVEALYIARKSYGLPGLTQKELFAQVYGADRKKWPSPTVRIQNFFRKGDAKRLWDAGCIGHDGKGSFHLNVKVHTHTQ